MSNESREMNVDSDERQAVDQTRKFDFFGQPIRDRLVYSLRADVFEFMDTTTIHALGNIARHNSIPLRIFITLCLLTSLGACTWQIVVAVINYLTYEITTTSSTQFEAPTEFPMVTFCSLNPYNMETASGYIHQYSDDGTVKTENYNTTIEYVNRVTDYFLYQIIQNNSLASQAYSDSCPDYYSTYNYYYGQDDTTLAYTTFGYYLNYYTSYTETATTSQVTTTPSDNSEAEATTTYSTSYCTSGNPGSGYSNKEFGFDIKQMLISCRYQNIECTADDFIYYYDYYYGNCYRFNSGKTSLGDDKPISYSGKPGWKYGLQLELYAGNSTSQEEFTVNRGFRIVVLNRTFTQQMIEDFGVDVSVGQATSIAVRRSFINHLKAPYGNCIENDIANIDWNQNEVLKFMYSHFIKGNVYDNGNWTWKWNVTYSQYICVNMCYQKYLLETCGCYDVTLPRSYLMTTHIINSACSNTTDQECRTKASAEFYESESLSGECYNKCPIECHEQKYLLATSVSQYPTRWYAGLLNKNENFNSSINYGMTNTVDYSQDYDSLRDSIAHVYVYYEDMLYTQIDESPAMDLLDLISYIGGLTGLFLGASLLSIIEPFVILYNLLYHKFCTFFVVYMNKSRRSENKVQDSSEGNDPAKQKGKDRLITITNHIRRQNRKLDLV